MTPTAGDGTSGPRIRREPLSFDEYLRLERLADVRHEYVGGQVFAMTGGSRRHGQLALLIGMALAEGFLPRGCRVFTHDTKLRVPTGPAYYPDVFVTCGPQGDPYFETDAVWVVEVLSESTRDKDTREKPIGYLKLPSIRGYLLVETTSRSIEVRTPAEVGWYIAVHRDGDILDLDGVKIAVSDLYDRLDALVPLTGSEGE